MNFLKWIAPQIGRGLLWLGIACIFAVLTFGCVFGVLWLYALLFV